MTKGLFITGTDTGIGKTVVCELLIKHFVCKGERVSGMKPVASGARMIDGELRNDDALTLMQAANVSADYALINPYCFEPAVAPHLATQQAQTKISMDDIGQCYEALAVKSDRVIVEGVGGWCVPIDAEHDMSDLVVQLQLPVIMVVGMRLGCLNHALLTARAIEAKGCKLIGWIANQIEPDMSLFNENLATLETRLNVPLLISIPHTINASTREFAASKNQIDHFIS